MRFKKVTLWCLIPSILVLYSLSMFFIQFGATKIDTTIENPDTPLNLDSEGSYIGQRLIFQYSVEDADFKENERIHNLGEKLHAERETGNSVKRRSDFKPVGFIYVFSAYLDTRIPGKTTVTLIALRKTIGKESIVCHFHIKNGSYVNVTSHSYEMCENHGRMYGGWMYFCHVPQIVLKEYSRRNRTISYVSLSSTNSSHHRLTKLKITSETAKIKTNSTGKSSLGVCIPPLFGDISISLFVQFVELSKILGITSFTFYIHQISDSIYKLLRFYNMKDEAIIVNWKLPDQIMDKEIWYHGQLLAIQDCLYRNMATSELLAFLDIDEFIIPSNHTDLSSLISDLRQNSTEDNFDIAGFSFKSAFFAPNQVLDPSEQLAFLQIRQRTKQLSAKRTKLIVQPQTVIELGIHHISKFLNENSRVLDVDPEISKIHHYRACAINYEPEMNCFKEIQDDSILKYGKKLVHNYKYVLKRTMPLFIPKQK